MALEDIQQLLRYELGDLLYAEKVFLKGLKQMSRETSNEMIRDRITQHAEESQEQIENLERSFELLGYRARAQKCDAAVGLDEERRAFKEGKNPSPRMLEAFNLGSGLRVEHYEIAGYRSAIALAEQVNSECARLLQRNLDQEIAMATFIESNAPQALAQISAEADEQER